MGRKFIALFMALLIGNPMCCCAMAHLILDESEETLPIHSCCSVDKPSQPLEQTSEDSDSCLCSLEKEKSTLNIPSDFLKAPKDDVKSEDFTVTNLSLAIPKLSLAVGHVSKWPPGSLPVIPLKEQLALRSTYLL